MTLPEHALLQRVAELRRSFDESFAKSHVLAASASVDLLVLRVERQLYAVRLSQIAGFQVAKKIVALPSPISELRGLIALRGTLIPVYDLGALLGHPSSRTPATLVLAKQAPIAFALDAFDHHLRVERESIARSASAVDFVREVVRTDEIARPILDLDAVVSAVKARTVKEHGFLQNKER
jgi:chemotaxis signal transduction protein